MSSGVASPLVHAAAPPRRRPAATYRLQLNRAQPLAAAAALVDYLDALGVSELYLSPVFPARPGSPHGYDVVAHDAISPELGGESALRALAARAAEHGLGLLLDLVPNHMCVVGGGNAWWQDLLENGPSATHARSFDVDWTPPKQELAQRVLLPILGDQYGRVLEAGELGVVRDGGSFEARYHEHVFPLAPRSWQMILEPTLERLRPGTTGEDEALVELESIITALGHLPLRSDTDPEAVRERQREKEVVKRRLSALVESSPEIGRALDAAVAELNGRVGEPRSFDRLEQLLADQAYRLCYWRVATDEINYRRFFDINELAAIRVEDPEVFEAVHALPLRLFEEGVVHGFRVDHVDGLLDPLDYLARLPRGAWVLVEKILEPGESLRERWRCHGTTGYEFLNALNGLFVEASGGRALVELFAELVGERRRFTDVVYECKKLILDVAMSSELTVLARQLDRVSEQHRFSRDFTLRSLQEGLAEVVACFPVYRSYIRDDDVVDAEDRRHIERAVRLARRRNPSVSESLFDFIASVLLREDPRGLDAAQQAERRALVLRFQQLTGPVMAKGLEDTAFYRYVPLVSANEVGGHAEMLRSSDEAFHAQNRERLERWPLALITTSTHDTKRDEDVRARLNVLSEVPATWSEAVRRWRGWNAGFRASVDEVEAPDAAEEYLLYQTLVGSWPLEPLDGPARAVYRGRIETYMLKALREAKLHTSWISPNEPYEAALRDFVAAVLDPERAGAFLDDFEAFRSGLVRPGLLNGVAQALLKLAAPGVPDFYQGTELPEFRLVDPDNRQTPDFEARRRALAALDAAAAQDPARLARQLLEAGDGRLKLYVTARALRLRRARPELFLQGEYLPAEATGERARHVVAFSRRHGADEVVAASGRFFTRLPASLDGGAWRGATLRWPGAAARFRDVLSGRVVEARTEDATAVIDLEAAFALLPFALLERLP